MLEAAKKTIKAIEYIFILSLITYYSYFAYKYIREASAWKALHVYANMMSFYYYLKLIFTKENITSKSANSICFDCNSLKNKSMSHCELCNKCIEYRDHHCSFVGKCICKKNINTFFFFIFFLCMQLFLETFDTSFPEIFVMSLILLSSYTTWACYVWSGNQTTMGFFRNEKKKFSLKSLYIILFNGRKKHIIEMFFPFYSIIKKIPNADSEFRKLALI